MHLFFIDACSPTTVDILRVKSLKKCTATAGRPLVFQCFSYLMPCELVVSKVVFLIYAPVAGRVTLKLTVEAGQTWRTTADLNLALS